MISKELTTELQLILKEDYGKDLPILEVERFGNALVNYSSLLAKIDEKGGDDE